MTREYGMRSVQGWGGPAWTDEDLAYLRENYAAMPAKDVAAYLGRPTAAIWARASLLGLGSHRRLGVNSLVKDYFKAIDTPMKAWVLGLLAADGSISKAGQLRLELHRKDVAIVEAVRDELASGAKVSFYSSRTSPMCRFMIGGVSIRADLASHGIVNAKSLITTWPASVPDRLVNSFICGYYDGDGSIGAVPNPRWAVVSGNPVFLRTMQAEILRLTGLRAGGPYADRRHDHAWSIVATCGPAEGIDAWIHEDVPGLTRKRLESIRKSDKVA